MTGTPYDKGLRALALEIGRLRREVVLLRIGLAVVGAAVVLASVLFLVLR